MSIRRNYRNKAFRRWLWAVILMASLTLLWIVLSPFCFFEHITLIPVEGAEWEVITTDDFTVTIASQQITGDPSPTVQTSQHELRSPPAHVVDVPPSDNCIACHTDKEQLQAVAEEPEEVKSEEASGEG
ncbi:MAG: hypothetical protein GXP42_02225 [Chloroflexi bacterium]|nr:hypothetical protein [Chloroflexota bacterium]